LGGSSPELFIVLSEAEHLRNNEARSRAYLERANTVDPANKNVRRQLGILYREEGEYARAIEMLKPALPEARLELALSYFDNKQFGEAALLFEELIQEDPDNVDLLYVLGKSYMEQREFPKASLMLQRVLQLKPDYVDAYSTMGTIYYVREDWARAAQFLLRFLELRPGQAVAHFVVANCFDNLGNAREALVHYNRFLELDTGSNDVQSFQARQRARILERRLNR
jgi:tetratricopeptide (TPR) repeat protein